MARGLLAGAELLVLDDVAGVLDEDNRQRVRLVIEKAGVAVIEATVDTPLLRDASVVVRP